MASASLSDASLFMDMDLFKEEEDATLQTAGMDFPTSSLELVQLLACEDDMFMDATASDDVFTCHDSNTNDDFSDAVTDDASSDMASPPPTFADDDTSHSPPSSPAVYGFACNVASTPSSGGAMPPCVLTPKTPPSPSNTASTVSSPMPTPSAPPLAPSTTTVTPVPPTAMLPFAFPVACFPPLNVNLKRPLPDVLPNQPAANLDPVEVKKSKRALRQMKNRESANRSRLRRKAQLSDLSGEVEELTKKQHELQNTIAALQAENKSLHDQNAFLRSLVTMYSDPTRAAALPPVPSAATSASVHQTMRPTASLSELESGSKSMTESMLDDVFDEDEDEDDIMTLPTPKKQRKSLGRSAATVSAASLGLCASMFGLTILTDSENAAAQSSHIRRPGRVLHSLPSTTDQGCTPSTMMSFVERLWETFTSSLEFLTTSDLAYGVFLNVLSFVVIMGLYHCFQQYVYKPRSSQRTFRWQNVQHRRVSNAAATQAKRRSVSWQDVRVEAQKAADNEANTSMPRVEIFM